MSQDPTIPLVRSGALPERALYHALMSKEITDEVFLDYLMQVYPRIFWNPETWTNTLGSELHLDPTRDFMGHLSSHIHTGATDHDHQIVVAWITSDSFMEWMGESVRIELTYFQGLVIRFEWKPFTNIRIIGGHTAALGSKSEEAIQSLWDRLVKATGGIIREDLVRALRVQGRHKVLSDVKHKQTQKLLGLTKAELKPHGS